MKASILFFSDCDYFAGCENMLSNFSFSEELREKYTVSISFRKSAPYLKGIRERTAFLDTESIPCTVYREVVGGKASSIVLRNLGKMIALLFRPVFFFADVVLAMRIVRMTRPTIVHVNNGGFPGSLSCNAMAVGARLGGAKNVVYVVNNQAVAYRSMSRILECLMDRLVVSCVDLFVTASLSARERLQSTLRLSSKRVMNLYNGTRLKEQLRARALVRSELGISDEDIAIGIVAVLEKRKGHRYLVDSFFDVVKNPGFEARGDIADRGRRAGAGRIGKASERQEPRRKSEICWKTTRNLRLLSCLGYTGLLLN